MIESLLWIQVGQIAKEEKDDNLNSLHLARTAHFLPFLERNSFVSSYKPLARTALFFPLWDEVPVWPPWHVPPIPSPFWDENPSFPPMNPKQKRVDIPQRHPRL